jgi:hypothetical protein
MMMKIIIFYCRGRAPEVRPVVAAAFVFPRESPFAPILRDVRRVPPVRLFRT